ncbi:MAG: hypothetical protein NTY64_23460 [Deltaproteobacteria bacterium]|nr:hypothetical protein [Deltaproteobacteria bacterium]
MNPASAKRDLIVLVADRNMEATISGLLRRHSSLGIRPVATDIRRHPEKDCGCRTGGIEFLSPFYNQYEHALLMFDFEGCGLETQRVEEVETELEVALGRQWGERGSVIVIAPELEIWAWSDSPHVDQVLGWAEREPDLRTWLAMQGFMVPGQEKPIRPKEALEKALHVAWKPRSSAIYQSLAEKVSLARCNDRAFIKLKTILQQWFKER